MPPAAEDLPVAAFGAPPIAGYRSSEIPPVAEPRQLWRVFLSFVCARRGMQLALAGALLPLILIPVAIWEEMEH
jgi:hypothetical protein